ncbi:proline reductase cluster protein PrdD [Vagococcus sp. BWB3-3]|uniref:Proline reductase cluster protein PrdD n=1 Tax=Vagococcus allomyrinae TaxID=2794353 RepID=A0A940P9D1_9ENTE|nr:proline reductase cluster protein PrdD [Vagococcus allomyrinae]
MSKHSTLKIKVFHVEQVSLGDAYGFKEKQLSLPLTNEQSHGFEKVTINIIEPFQHDVEINTIMDVLPISTKVLGQLGDGITHTLTGVYVLMTGKIKNGAQMHEFGSSNGKLANQMVFGKNGTPAKSDYLIHIDLIAKEGAILERKLCLEMFAYVDEMIQPIRDLLKMADGRYADETHEYRELQSTGKPKVAIVKQVAGQGAMYDNLLFPNEPSGFVGGVSIIDTNNMPVLLSPNEYRDGAIRAMV